MDTEKLKETTAKGKRGMTPNRFLSVRKRVDSFGWIGMFPQEGYGKRGCGCSNEP